MMESGGDVLARTGAHWLCCMCFGQAGQSSTAGQQLWILDACSGQPAVCPGSRLLHVDSTHTCQPHAAPVAPLSHPSPPAPYAWPAVDENRRSAVHFAAAMGKAQLVQRLLAAGGEVDLADKEGEQRCQQFQGWSSGCAPVCGLQQRALIATIEWRAACMAAQLGCMLRFMLLRLASPLPGYTPLHMAAGYMHTSTIAALLAGGADPEQEDRQGRRRALLGHHCSWWQWWLRGRAAAWSHRQAGWPCRAPVRRRALLLVLV